MIRTFFDSGVLIAGAKGIPAERAKALAVLRDPGRQFLMLRADEFVTTEKPTKSIYRSTLVKIVYLFG
jgi:hypothetical protein